MTTTLITDIKSIDTLDDRREAWYLLHRLSPRHRFRFLHWLCQHAYLPRSKLHPQASWFRMGPRIRKATQGDDRQDYALTQEIYSDILALCLQYQLSAKFAVQSLEQAVRRGLRSLPVPPDSSSAPSTRAVPSRF
jgi:hypothetical protein